MDRLDAKKAKALVEKSWQARVEEILVEIEQSAREGHKELKIQISDVLNLDQIQKELKGLGYTIGESNQDKHYHLTSFMINW